MKKILYLSLAFLVMFGSLVMVCSAAKDRKFEQNPVEVLEAVKKNANSNKIEEIQKTEYDNTTSRSCSELSIGPEYTITRTLCNIKDHSKDYIQYLMYIGLTAATIILIRNGFKIVTSTDREKEFGNFKKNLAYIVIGVVLLTGFYYILDLFISVINLVAE